jgi:hypothetical protein
MEEPNLNIEIPEWIKFIEKMISKKIKTEEIKG